MCHLGFGLNYGFKCGGTLSGSELGDMCHLGFALNYGFKCGGTLFGFREAELGANVSLGVKTFAS